jgi:predicted RND superfamily exporter protein
LALASFSADRTSTPHLGLSVAPAPGRPPAQFRTIIALPLLLGVGVAFKVYYIMAWRAGKTGLLQSTLTRAVVFSAMTNAVAFGSMWTSNYPGMSSMGKLIALLCTWQRKSCSSRF